ALQGRGSARFVGGGSWIIRARRWRVANLREGPLRLDLHLEVRLHSSSLRGVARRRARNRSVSPSGSPDPWAAVPTVGSLVGAGDPGAGAGVDTRSSSVDTRGLPRKPVVPVWDSVSTLDQVVSTLEAFPEHLLG
ncbi:hypothetical protein Taro_009914, partial [Colocasia esculenta]|nr:hypothetical protein [Colocasia esculenta]